MLEMAKLQKKTEELYNSNELLVAQLSALRMRSSKSPTKEAETLHSSVQTDGNVDKEKVFTEHNIEEALKERVKELESEIAKLRAAPAKRVEESESAVKFHNMASRSALDEMDEVLYHNAEDSFLASTASSRPVVSKLDASNVQPVRNAPSPAASPRKMFSRPSTAPLGRTSEKLDFPMRASVDDFSIDAKGQSHLSTSALFDTVAMSEDDFVVHSVNREELEREVARQEKVEMEEDVRATSRCEPLC